MPPVTSLGVLRERLAKIHAPTASSPASRVYFSADKGDVGFPHGLKRNALHEVYADTAADTAAADAFALGIGVRAGRRDMVWIVETRRRFEVGDIYGLGLKSWGLDPETLLLVETAGAVKLLAAAEEALRSGAVGAVLISAWGESPAHDLTASRRLNLAAETGGSMALLVRAAARPRASAAETRWRVAAAPSRPLPAGAPGLPAFRAALTRSRAGVQGGEWIMEWSGESRSFVRPQTASGDLVSVSVQRPAEAYAA